MKNAIRLGRPAVRNLAGKYLISASEWPHADKERSWYLRGRASALCEALESVTGVDDEVWEALAQEFSLDVEDTVQSIGNWALDRLEQHTDKIPAGLDEDDLPEVGTGVAR